MEGAFARIVSQGITFRAKSHGIPMSLSLGRRRRREHFLRLAPRACEETDQLARATMPPRDTSRWAHVAPAYTLRQDSNDHATVLRSARPRVVGYYRLQLAVADHADLVQRQLVMHVEVSLHRVGSLETEPLVVGQPAAVVGMTFDLDDHVLRLGHQL